MNPCGLILLYASKQLRPTLVFNAVVKQVAESSFLQDQVQNHILPPWFSKHREQSARAGTSENRSFRIVPIITPMVSFVDDIIDSCSPLRLTRF